MRWLFAGVIESLIVYGRACLTKGLRNFIRTHDDIEEILAYYYLELGPATAEAVERRIVSQVEGLDPFSERVRKSDRISDTRELVVNRLRYVAFVKRVEDGIVVLNVVHTARTFPK